MIPKMKICHQKLICSFLTRSGRTKFGQGLPLVHHKRKLLGMNFGGEFAKFGNLSLAMMVIRQDAIQNQILSKLGKKWVKIAKMYFL